MKRISGVAAAVLLMVLGLAGPVGAHANVEEIRPAPNSVNAPPPKELSIRFSEAVQAAPGAVRCFEASGARLDTGAPKVDGAVVRTPLEITRNGGYVCTWRVTSADGHVVTGAVSFTVGSGTAVPLDNLAARLLTASSTDPVVLTGLRVASGLTYAGLALVIGPALFIAVGALGWRRRPRAGWLLWGGAGAALLGTAMTLLLQGPYVEGRGVADAFNASLLRITFDERVGQTALARLIMLVAAALLIAVLRAQHEPPSWWKPAGALVAIGLAVSVGASGHAATGSAEWFWISVATVHVAVMAVWLGGLALLVAEALPGGEADDDVFTALTRFSPIATLCVIALGVTGVLQAYREVETVDALFSTTYGRLLMVKVAAFAIALLVALRVRRTALAPKTDQPRPTPRRALAVECAFVVVALCFTAMLTSTVPANVDYARQGSSSFVTTATLDFDVSISAATQIGRQLHVIITDHATGAQTDVEELKAQWTKGDLGPLDQPLAQLSPGHYVSDSVQLPGSGTWTLTLRARTSNFDEVAVVTKLRVG